MMMSRWLEELESPDSNICRQALQKVKELGPEARACVPALIAALDRVREGQPYLIEAFAEALRAIGRDAGAAVPLLVSLLDWAHRAFRMSVPLAVLWIGGEPYQERLAMRCLLRMGGGCSDELATRHCCMELLQQRPDQIVPCLTELLIDADQQVRRWATDLLGEPSCNNKASHMEAAAPRLMEVIRTGGNKDERVAALEVLANMGPQAKGTTLLLGLLTDPDEQLPWRALEALKSRPEWTPRILQVLTAALKDLARKMRSRAVTMLLRLDPEISRPALPALREAIQDEDAHVQSHAREAVLLIESCVP